MSRPTHHPLTPFLQHHPDKAGARSSSSSQVIHKLYTAHQVLSNDDSRAIYDAELAQRRDTSLSSTSHTARPPRVSATLDLDTFEPTDEEAIRFEHPCRCGANYIVSADDLMMEGFELVECSGCSEVVKVAWRDETDEDGRQGHE